MTAIAIWHSWKLIVIYSVVLGILAGAFFFLPRVSVDPGEPIDPQNPLGTATFVVSNTGIIPLENVGASFALCLLETIPNGPRIAGPNYQDCNRHNVGGEIADAWRNHRLDIDGKWTFSLRDILPEWRLRVETLDAGIIISYTPKYFGIPWSKEFRFRAKRTPDGQLRWFHSTIDKN